MTHEKQTFVTDELTALLRRIDPTITGAAYVESLTAAHVVISYRDKPTVSVEVTECDLLQIALTATWAARLRLREDKP